LLQTSQLLKEYDEAYSGYSKVYNQAFTAFPKNVGLNNGLSAAQPDRVGGLNIGEFDRFPVRQELGGAAVPTSGPHATTLQHFTREWKGPGKDMIEAQTQAAYDGACMVHGRNEARSFLQSPDPAGHAFVSTFTTDGTTLNTFGHYSSQSEGQVKYHQFPDSSSFLIASYEDFKKSRRRLRNLEDEAKETSEKLRDELIEKWSANQEDPTNQVVTEYWTSFSTNNQDESSVQVPAAESVYTPPSASFHENNQGDSFASDSVYAPPYANLPVNDEDDSSLQIPPADSVYAPPYANLPVSNRDDPYRQAPIADNGYASLDASTYTPITPPQSADTEAREAVESKVRGNKRTRRTQTRAADTIEEPTKVHHTSKGRKTRSRRYS
jgi:hypothetical protein